MSGIKINSNIASLNAQRNFSTATKKLNENYTRLSSGLRINKAVDDSSGLAISENLKSETRLSAQAIKNVNDGISLISVVTGALDSQKTILYRMAEIAEQSSNGVYSSQQRLALQKEYSSLLDEFDRVAKATTFNGISLLKDENETPISIMAGVNGVPSSMLSMLTSNSHRFAGNTAYVGDFIGNDGLYGVGDFGQFRSYLQNPDGYAGSANAVTTRVQDTSIIFLQDSAGNEIMFQTTLAAPFGGASNATPVTSGRAVRMGSGTVASSFSAVAIDPNSTSHVVTATFADGATASYTYDFTDLTYERYEVNADAVNTAIGFTNVYSRTASKNAVDTVKNKIGVLSSLQGMFGAIESRLSFAANLLSVNRESFSAAVSQIVDTDIAEESAKLTSNQILQQSASGVLAQANQQPAIVLRLLDRI